MNKTQILRFKSRGAVDVQEIEKLKKKSETFKSVLSVFNMNGLRTNFEDSRSIKSGFY